LDILNQQSEGVIPRQKHVFQNVFNSNIFKVQRVSMNERAVHQIQTKSVCSVLSNDDQRIGVIFFAFGHFLPVLGQNETVYDQIFVGGLVFESGTNDIQGVEPASGLIDSFSDEISREHFAELLLVSRKRIMNLCVRHRATFEPAIEDLSLSFQFLPRRFYAAFLCPFSREF
jgi:hypothetical protein